MSVGRKQRRGKGGCRIKFGGSTNKDRGDEFKKMNEEEQRKRRKAMRVVSKGNLKE